MATSEDYVGGQTVLWGGETSETVVENFIADGTFRPGDLVKRTGTLGTYIISIATYADRFNEVLGVALDEIYLGKNDTYASGVLVPVAIGKNVRARLRMAASTPNLRAGTFCGLDSAINGKIGQKTSTGANQQWTCTLRKDYSTNASYHKVVEVVIGG